MGLVGARTAPEAVLFDVVSAVGLTDGKRSSSCGNICGAIGRARSKT